MNERSPAAADPFWRADGMWVLLALAVAQAVFLVAVPEAPVTRRIVAVCLLGITAAEWWRPWLFAHSPRLGLWMLAGLTFANYVWYLVASDLPIRARLVQAGLILGYAGAAIAGAMIAARITAGARAFTIAMGLAALLLLGEAWLGLPEGRFLWTGAPALRGDVASETGLPGAGESAWSAYPVDARAYFEDPLTFQASWLVEANDMASAADLEFPDSPLEAIRVRIERTSGREYLAIRLIHGPVALREGEVYSLALRARAAASGTLAVALDSADPPWGDVVRFETLAVDTAWAQYEIEFTPVEAGGPGRLHLDVGQLSEWVEFARITLRSARTGERLRPLVPDTHGVRYEFDARGCRVGDGSGSETGSTRVLVAGRATAFGVGVHAEDAFAARLGAKLGGGAWDVVNCGFVGTGMMGPFLANAVSSLQPDITLLVLGEHECVRWLPPGTDRDPALPGKLERLFLTWNALSAMLRGRPLCSGWTESEIVDAVRALQPRPLAMVVIRTGTESGSPGVLEAARAAAQATGVPLLDAGPALTSRRAPMELVVDRQLDHRPNHIGHELAADTAAALIRGR